MSTPTVVFLSDSLQIRKREPKRKGMTVTTSRNMIAIQKDEVSMGVLSMDQYAFLVD